MAAEFYVPGADGTTAADTGVGMPGGPPSTTPAMQGNPFPANVNQPIVAQLPNPQNSATQVLGAGPDTGSLIAQGLVPLNAQPTNANVQPGGDSLLAQISRGQMSLNQSNYGQGSFIPQNGGASPQAPQPGSASVVPVTAGNPSTPTYASPANVTGA